MSSVALRGEFENVESELPGITSHGYASYSLATALAHSSRYNMRGLEYYSYGFYDILLKDLVDDLVPRALVIPQFGLGALDIELDEDFSDSDSIVTLSKKASSSQLVPDFAIVLLRAIFIDGGQPVTTAAFHQEFESWRKIKIERLSIALLAEAKRRPTRTALDFIQFAGSLTFRMQTAQEQLKAQAAATFVAYPKTNQLILIAFVGEWFSWRLVIRKDRNTVQGSPNERTANNSTGRPHAQAEISHSVDQDPQPTVHPPGVSNPSQSNRLPHRTSRNPAPVHKAPRLPKGMLSSTVPYNPNPNQRRRGAKGLAQQKAPSKSEPRRGTLRRYIPADLATADIGVVFLHEPLTDEVWKSLNEGGGSFDSIRRNLLNDSWSGCILFGTQESKESWFLIQKALEEQMTCLDNFEAPIQPGDASNKDCELEEELEELDLDEYDSLHESEEEDDHSSDEDYNDHDPDADFL